MTSKDLIRELVANGWILDRVKGSHHTFRHPDLRHAVTVPHPKKDLGIGLVKAIKKQAGI
jgi:predicted RNA binding protein YcfA (HicA-like mRNA interferase family)